MIKTYLKIIFPSFLSFFLYTLVLFVFIIPYTRKSFLNQKRLNIKELTENVVKVVEFEYNAWQRDGGDKDSALLNVLSLIEEIRYGKEGLDYFWVIDTMPTMLEHPYRKDLVGMDMNGYSDNSGANFFQEAVKKAKNYGEGYIDYLWQWNNDSSRILLKESYIAYFEPWGLIVGTGIYNEDVQQEISQIVSKIIIVSILILLLLSIISIYTGRRSLKLERQKQNSEKARELSENKFRTIFNSATDGIMIFTRTGEMLEVNDYAVKRTGFSREEMLQQNANTFFQNNPEITIEKVLKHLEKNNIFTFNLDYYGYQMPIEVNVRNVIFEGKEAVIAISRDISERVLMEKRIFSAELNAQETERQRVARELHDGISPILSTVKLFVQSLQKCNDEKLKDDILNKTMSSIDESIKSISEISNNLSPHMLQNFGLQTAIQTFAEKVGEANNVELNFRTNCLNRFDQHLETTVYRIVTELINNSIKHSKAGKLNIDCFESSDKIAIMYRDNGIGFDFEKVMEEKKGMGLFNFINRLKSINGHFSFKRHENGVEYNIEVPIDIR